MENIFLLFKFYNKMKSTGKLAHFVSSVGWRIYLPLYFVVIYIINVYVGGMYECLNYVLLY